MFNPKIHVDREIKLPSKLNNFRLITRSSDNVLLSGLLIIALILRIVYLFQSGDCSVGDSGTRLYLSYFWSLHPSFILGYNWLPLHFYILGSTIAFFDNTIWMPRVVTLLFAMASFIPFYGLVKNLFSRKTAFYSTLIFVLLPAHILLSVITATEAPFTFFIIAAIFYAFKFINSRRNIDLLATSLFLLFANWIRFEGWGYSGLILMVFAFEKISVRQFGFIALTVFIVIGYYTFDSWLETGNPVWGLTNQYVTGHNVNARGIAVLDNIQNVPLAFFPLWFLFFPIGAIAGTKDKLKIYYLLFAVGALLFMIYKVVIIKDLIGEFRYFVISGILLLPFITEGILYLIKRGVVFFKCKTIVSCTCMVCICVCLSLWNYKAVLLKPLDGCGKYNPGFIPSAVWVKQYCKNARLLIDDDGCDNRYLWMVYSDNLGLRESTVGSPLNKSCVVEVAITGIKSENELVQVIKEKDITHLVLFKNGWLNNLLPEKRYTKVYDSLGYRIYYIKTAKSYINNIN
jgi:hypothetical protein